MYFSFECNTRIELIVGSIHEEDLKCLTYGLHFGGHVRCLQSDNDARGERCNSPKKEEYPP